MNNDNLYQNPETYQENPIKPEVSTSPSAPASNKKFTIPSDPKLRLLFILAIVIIVLVFLSLISFFIRKPPAVSTPIITPTKVISPSPVPTSAIDIPNDLQFQLDQISKLSLSPDFADPPTIHSF